MITAFLQFNHSPAIVASLPTSLLGGLQKSVRLFIFRTIFRTMPFSVAKTTDFGLTATAFPNFLAVLLMDIAWLNPFTTSPGRTVDTILGRIFSKFNIPVLLESVIK
jgi:hypothetical protein